MSESKTYPVAETFLSFQGEGLHSGRRAYFIRLFGCGVKCPWCDSRSAWEGSPAETVSAKELAARAKSSGAEFAVITGGEPCIHDLSALLAELSKNKIAAHLETSGTLPVTESSGAAFAWVALSPKLFAPARADALRRADELKMIVSNAAELFAYAELADAARAARALWLHPEWSKSSDMRLLEAMRKFVESRGGRWRLGWQLHKNYSAR